MRLAAQYVKRGGVARVGWLEKIDHGVWGALFTQAIGGNAPLEKSSGAFFYNEVEDCLFDSWLSGQNVCPVSGADAGQRPFFMKDFLLGKVRGRTKCVSGI